MSVMEPLKLLTESDMQDRVNNLRDLVSGNHILTKYETDSAYLLRFLFSTDFNVPVAFERAYFNFISENPLWCAATSPLEKKDRLEDNDKAFIDGRDKSGRPIIIIKLGKININETSPEVHSQLFDIYTEALIEDHKTMATGISIILDMKGYSWKLFRWLTPSNIRNTVKKLELFPVKELVFHIVNTSFLVNASIKLIWPFLSEKFRKMIKFHFEDWPSLHEYIDPQILPPEYRGTGPVIDFEKTHKFLLAQSSEIEKRLKSRNVVVR